MSIDPTLPLVMAQQLGPATRVVNDAAAHPEISQNMTRVMTEAVLREESRQVTGIEDGDQSSAISDESGGNKQSFMSRRHRKPEQEDEPAPAESSPSSEGPFLGNLLNRKI